MELEFDRAEIALEAALFSIPFYPPRVQISRRSLASLMVGRHANEILLLSHLFLEDLRLETSTNPFSRRKIRSYFSPPTGSTIERSLAR